MQQILVVDDDPVIQRLVSVTLSDEGYDVVLASDGEQALALATDSPPDAIILDLEMPRVDGRAAFHELRERGIYSPVIILSANGAHDARRELDAEGALEKPFDPADLLRGVRRAILAQEKKK